MTETCIKPYDITPSCHSLRAALEGRTPALSRCRKRERSGRCRQSAAVPCYAALSKQKLFGCDYWKRLRKVLM
jgi:hypothetical protein